MARCLLTQSLVAAKVDGKRTESQARESEGIAMGKTWGFDVMKLEKSHAGSIVVFYREAARHEVEHGLRIDLCICPILIWNTIIRRHGQSSRSAILHTREP